MRIVWHMPTLRRRACGLSRRAVALAQQLRKYGHAVTFLVAQDKTDVFDDTIEGIALRRVPVKKRPPVHWCFQAKQRVEAAAAMVERISLSHELFVSCQPEGVSAYASQRRRRPLLYVCGGTTLLHDRADRADLGRRATFPFVWRLPCTVDQVIKRGNERKAFKCADAVVFDSHNTREIVIGAYRLDGNRCHTVHGGIHAERFRPPDNQTRLAARRRQGIGQRDFVVAWTGRMSPEKNLDLLIQALPHCSSPPDTVLLVGDGPVRGELVALVEGLGLTRRVIFSDEQADVRPFLHAADVFAFPSRGESFGAGLVEAMGCGLACVGLLSDGQRIRNANSEIIQDGKSGVLVESTKPAAFAAALDSLAGDGVRRRWLGEEARRRACEHFTWEAGGRQLETLISKLVRGGTRSDIQAGEAASSAAVAIDGA